MNINDSFIEKDSLSSDDEYDFNKCNAHCDKSCKTCEG